MSDSSNLKTGSKALYFFEAKKLSDLKKPLSFWRENLKKGRLFILGQGTNVLFLKDFSGIVLKIGFEGIKKIGNDSIFVLAGTSVSKVINFCFKNKLAGLEWASGLPGTIGGAIRGNAGAFGGEIKDSVASVVYLDVLDRDFSLKIKNNKECKFGYRDSVFKEESKKGKQSIILGCFLKLKSKKDIIAEIKKSKEILKFRKEKHPMEYPTLGSTFKNISLDNVSKKIVKSFKEVIKIDPFPVIPVAAVLDRAGIKGKSLGAFEFSRKHPNFLIKTKPIGKPADAFKLINIVKKEIRDKFGIIIEEEIEIVS